MSRHRYIASDMGADEKIEELAEKAGMPAVALYMLLIPNLDDWGRMDGRVREIKHRIVPALPYTVDSIDRALTVMHELGLLVRYQVEGRPYIAVDQAAFYRHQTYLKKDRRDKDESKIPPPTDPRATSAEIAQIAHSAQGAEKLALFSSPSPSPSSSSTPSVGADAPSDDDVVPPDQKVIGAFIQEFQGVIGRPAKPNERSVIGRYAKSSPDRLAEAISEMRGVLAKGGAVREPLSYLARLINPKPNGGRTSPQQRAAPSRYLTPEELGLMPSSSPPATTGPPPESPLTAGSTGGGETHGDRAQDHSHRGAAG